MIKVIKIDNFIYENIEPYYVDEEGNQVWNIPNNLTQLKSALGDTLSWLVAQKISAAVGSADKKDASVSKAVVLLAKILSTLNLDTTQLTTNEQAAFQKMLDLANSGYSDSLLLNDMLSNIQTHLQWYAQRMQALQGLTTLDELIQFAETLSY